MILDEAVEAAAKAHYERGGLSFWESANPSTRDDARDRMSAALEAAETRIMAKASYRLGKYLAEADGKEVWSQVPEAYLRQANEILRG